MVQWSIFETHDEWLSLDRQLRLDKPNVIMDTLSHNEVTNDNHSHDRNVPQRAYNSHELDLRD
jgi:hypothetical protein